MCLSVCPSLSLSVFPFLSLSYSFFISFHILFLFTFIACLFSYLFVYRGPYGICSISLKQKRMHWPQIYPFVKVLFLLLAFSSVSKSSTSRSSIDTQQPAYGPALYASTRPQCTYKAEAILGSGPAYPAQDVHECCKLCQAAGSSMCRRFTFTRGLCSFRMETFSIPDLDSTSGPYPEGCTCVLFYRSYIALTHTYTYVLQFCVCVCAFLFVPCLLSLVIYFFLYHFSLLSIYIFTFCFCTCFHLSFPQCA